MLRHYIDVYTTNYKFSQYRKHQEMPDANRCKPEFCGKRVDLIAYCLMPTHYHLVLSALSDNGISKYLQQLLNSYAKYFNIKYKRKGPLWESRFDSVHVTTDEQLLHLTRYIHLNPTSAGLVNTPIDWRYSSLREYLTYNKDNICNFSQYVDLSKINYKKFVYDRIDYQKTLKIIQHLL